VLITQQFVFIHLPKTGGEFLREVCAEQFQDSLVEHAVHKHAGGGQVPAAYATLPRFALIRNPWDWYVSWFHYLKSYPFSYPVWRQVSNDGTNDFKTTVANLCSGRVERSDPKLAQRLRERDVGLLTIHYDDMARGSVRSGLAMVGKSESLAEDFLRFLARHDIAYPSGLETALAEAPAINQSRHGPYQAYYDDDLRQLVAFKDRMIIEAYGYVFE